MCYKKSKFLKMVKNEEGIALIFSLLFMGLLLIMAMSFLSDAIFENKITNNYSSSSSGKMMLDIGLNQVTNLIAKRFSPGGSDNKLYSHVAGGAQDQLDKLFADGIVKRSDDPTGGNYHDLTWDPVRVPLPDNKSRVVGRIAFVAAPCAGIDPATIVNPAVNEAATPRTAANAAEKRIGAKIDEVNIRDISSEFSDSIAARFNYNNQPNGLYSIANPWLGFNDMFARYAVSGINLDENQKTAFRKTFVLNSEKQKEAFWLDTNKDGKLYYNENDPNDSNNELFNRFNLQELSNINSVDELLMHPNSSGKPNWSELEGVRYPNNSENMHFIPWLAYWGYDENYLLEPKFVVQRKQIAANLLDYCDSDSEPTSNIPNSQWADLTKSIEYTGNEKTAYINEVAMGVEFDVQAHSTWLFDFDKHITVSMTYDILVELINIYKDLPTDAYDIQMMGQISCYLDFSRNSSWPNQGDRQVNFPVNVTISNVTLATNAGYVVGASVGNSIGVYRSGGSFWGAGDVIVNNIQFRVDRVLLKNRRLNKYVDCALEKKNAYGAEVVVHDVADLPRTYNLKTKRWLSFEARDPRCNLYEQYYNSDHFSFWQPYLSQSSVTSGSLNIPESISMYQSSGQGPVYGRCNQRGNPLTYYLATPNNIDPESATDPALGSLSTAYIRNGPMINAGELGLIHRGVPYQTINLKKYDHLKNNVPSNDNTLAGGGAYSRGDANILEQVKIGSDLTNYKLNVNSSNRGIINGLLSHIRSDPLKRNVSEVGALNSGKICLDKPAADGDSSSIGISPIIDSILSKNAYQAATGLSKYSSRANVVTDFFAGYYNNVSNPAGPFGQPTTSSVNTHPLRTDAAMEELVGKFVNLTYCGKDEYFYVIILTQTIKDVGGDGDGITIHKDGVTKDCKLGELDYDNLAGVCFDQITGEQLFVALIRTDENGACKLLSLERIYH